MVFKKGGFGRCSPGRKTERGPIWMSLRNENRNEGTFACRGTKTERGYIRQNHPFMKLPFLFPLEIPQSQIWNRQNFRSEKHESVSKVESWRIDSESPIRIAAYQCFQLLSPRPWNRTILGIRKGGCKTYRAIWGGGKHIWGGGGNIL